MDSRRDFLKKLTLLSGGAGLMGIIPPSIQKALAINPDPGTTWLDAEHVVFLMQENRSFDHCFGTLQGVRGFNDPRAISLPDKNPVWLQTNADGQTFAPFRLDMHNSKATWMGGLPHSWSDQVDARNGGKYDKWLIAKQYRSREYPNFPMAMGYYTREDLPFYYALADAFTVCDHNFCSSLTGTTPNRLYFWSGTIREDANAKARVWNGDTDYEDNAAWTTYPERLEQNGISWRIYQNELSVGDALTSDQDAWLANFTDNPIEWMEQYHVKLTPTYIDYLQKAPELIGAEIEQLEKALHSATGKKAEDIQKRIDNTKQKLKQKIAEQKIYTRERYEQLSEREKNLLNKAFTTNSSDPDYHELTTLKYKDGNEERELVIPKGDILHEFRKDVNEGKLPTVSWLIAPEKFSDHPSAPWFGAWYVSEVLDILTKNPEVWKKTIFVLTYDENDGYFDHVPPFVSPHKPGSGKASQGINTAAEYVSKEMQSSDAEDVRENAIGLGYRVPMVIASPWSRGGWVNSQVFDHTSNLQMLEKFLQHKIGKQVKETNITDWRRCVCGDLSSVFRPYNSEEIEKPKPVEREPFIESIYNAKFKKAPEDWSPLSKAEIAKIKENLSSSSRLPQQEKVFVLPPLCLMSYMRMQN
ncbi:MAG: phosphocholine-specific phospholipase C [Ilyomonas sp.]